MTISDLDFADDICLLEHDFNAAQVFLASVIVAAVKTGLIKKAKKIKQCSETMVRKAKLWK